MRSFAAILRSLLLGALLGAAMGAHAAPVLIVNGSGILEGAKNVSVLGTLYDVTFADGTCAAIFSGCDQNSDFLFQNVTVAAAAAVALRDTVFLDSAAGLFDSVPALIAGCVGTLEACFTYTPYMMSGSNAIVSFVANWIPTTADTAGPGGARTPLDDSSLHSNTNYAIWSLSPVQPIPEPGSWVLISLGLASLAVVRRRRR